PPPQRRPGRRAERRSLEAEQRMRVIAGSARGIVLRQPRGSGTRPTSGRLRESLFAMLEAAGADFSAALDLYAGTGALGIEALSRGNGRCTFIDTDARAIEAIRENLRHVGFEDRATVVPARVGRWRPPEDARYTLVTADPPYDDGQAWAAIAATVERVLAPHAIVAVEHSARLPSPEVLAGLSRWRERRQGDGAVALYRAAESG
ncbi:MAG TPA: 16S rRNA (guanine(966)-N(2))-methyltransferase RsmD, partial [Dehalococcoidia bacterium]|nr:16S rRNA (guanine(966)-N(2))-methyltransferase RsmD [Dehalococcoidia bacterium]